MSLFATGSEVSIAVEARKLLRERGIAARVVSVPCFELFLRAAGDAERQAIIGTRPVKVAVEAAVRQGWDAIIGADGAFVGMTRFGASAPYKELYKHFGITAEAVAEAALSKLGEVVTGLDAGQRRRRSREWQFGSPSTGSAASAATSCAPSWKPGATTSRSSPSTTSRRSRPTRICCATTRCTAAFPAR